MSQQRHEQNVVVVNERGLHARAAAKFVAKAAEFSSEIYVSCNGERVNANSIMELLMLACQQGKRVTIEASGEDAADAVGALASLVDDGFGEVEE
jgi:phosphocarrier protein